MKRKEKMLAINIMAIWLMFSTFSFCQSRIKVNENYATSNEDLNFDRAYNNVKLKYQWLDKVVTSPSDTLLPHDLFKVHRSEYSRDLGITIQLRDYTACGGCWNFKMLYLTDNNSYSIVIPFTDEYFLYKKACKDEAAFGDLIFEDELRSALTAYIKNRKIKRYGYSTFEIIDILFGHILQEERIGEKEVLMEIESSSRITSDTFLNSRSINLPRRCKENYKLNLERVAKTLSSSNSKDTEWNIIYYSLGVSMAYIEVHFTNNGNIKINYINPECYCFPLY